MLKLTDLANEVSSLVAVCRVSVDAAARDDYQAAARRLERAEGRLSGYLTALLEMRPDLLPSTIPVLKRFVAEVAEACSLVGS